MVHGQAGQATTFVRPTQSTTPACAKRPNISTRLLRYHSNFPLLYLFCLPHRAWLGNALYCINNNTFVPPDHRTMTTPQSEVRRTKKTVPPPSRPVGPPFSPATSCLVQRSTFSEARHLFCESPPKPGQPRIAGDAVTTVMYRRLLPSRRSCKSCGLCSTLLCSCPVGRASHSRPTCGVAVHPQT